MVTDRDILRRCAVLGRYPDEAKVEKIAGSSIITARPDATAGEAMRTMIESLFVVEEGKVVGRVTQSGLFRYMLDVIVTIASLPHRL
jgi:CBS domain-containing protein